MGWGEEWQGPSRRPAQQQGPAPWGTERQGPIPRGVTLPGPALAEGQCTARPGQFSLPSGGGELIRHSASGLSRTVPGGQEATESARAENVTLGTHFMTRSLANSTKS